MGTQTFRCLWYIPHFKKQCFYSAPSNSSGIFVSICIFFLKLFQSNISKTWGSWFCVLLCFQLHLQASLPLGFSFIHLVNMHCFPTMWQSLCVFVFYGCCNKVPQISLLKTTQMYSLKFLEVICPRSTGWSQSISRAGFFQRVWEESASCLFQVLKEAYIPWLMDSFSYQYLNCLPSLMPHLPFMLWSCCTPYLRNSVISVSHWIVQDNLSISKSLITSVKLLLPCKVTIHKSWELWHDNFVLIYYTMQVSRCSREQDGPWEGIWQTPSSSIHYKILQGSNDRLIFM